MVKHLDNKDDLINRMKKLQRQNETSVSSAFSAFMLLALMTLREEESFKFGNVRAERFITEMGKQLNKYNSGNLTVPNMQDKIFKELGIIIEMPTRKEADVRAAAQLLGLQEDQNES